jgi:K+-sensing histidine kinase KdpD
MNPNRSATNDRLLETMLVLITAALACVMYYTATMKIVVLNLFFLPVVLAGFFMGRYRAGVLALLSVIGATIVSTTDLNHFGAFASPVMVAMAITLWGAVLGLTALLVGTLSDERDAKAVEAHEAHVGVVEVLARYLQSANPNLEHRAKQVARLSEDVARKMRLSPKEIDDIRLAALLIDMENIEITARVIRKAVGELEEARAVEQRTFCGTELVRSLGSVLSGAFPLLLSQTQGDGASGATASGDLPFGARILGTVRAYVQLLNDPWHDVQRTSEDVLEELRTDLESEHHPAVLHALQEVVSERPEPAAARNNRQELAQV